MINTLNLAQNNNFVIGVGKIVDKQGTPLFADTLLMLTSVNIPGMSLNNPSVSNTKSKGKIFLPSDTLEFSDLNLEILVDENFQVFKEIYEFVNKSCQNGVFENTEFNMFISILNSKGNEVLKLDFFNTKITNVSDLNLSTQSIENLTLSLTLNYEYYDLQRVENENTTQHD